ncbi:MAG: DUF2505 domain-containing protein [Bifidobacteriaceae bacterium]|nr:DUF2505 domain-containing protein [Bifidobacteriaceae bacterium]
MRLTAGYSYPVPANQVATLLADRDFLVEAANAAGADAVQVDVSVEESGEFTVTTRAINPHTKLPLQMRPFLPHGLEIRLAQAWDTADSDGRRDGTMAGEIVGAPVQITGRIAITPTPGGSRFTFSGAVTAQVPLVGQAIEQAAEPAVMAYLEAQDRVARRWLTLAEPSA